MTNPRPYKWKSLNEFSSDARQLLFSFAEPYNEQPEGCETAEGCETEERSFVRGQNCPPTAEAKEFQTGTQVGKVLSASAPVERAHQ